MSERTVLHKTFTVGRDEALAELKQARALDAARAAVVEAAKKVEAGYRLAKKISDLGIVPNVTLETIARNAQPTIDLCEAVRRLNELEQKP